MQLRLLVLIAVTFAPLTLVPDCCSDRHYAIGQESQATLEPITLVESKSFVWDGFANARVVDGKVIRGHHQQAEVCWSDIADRPLPG